jgi:2',3'-cyclic-nucleotide 2'-phosphodiesterase/3'-nucleotidase/5'-nucleotidase
MKYITKLPIIGFAAFGLAAGAAAATAAAPTIKLRAISTMVASTPGTSAAEIVTHDPGSQRLFVVNALNATIDVFDIHDPLAPFLVGSIDVTPYGAVANSVAVNDGVLAVAVEADPKTPPGHVAFFDTNSQFLAAVEVGAQPDMVTFTSNGRYVLTANEGEPSTYAIPATATTPAIPADDPEGSISVIDVSAGVSNLTQADVRTAGFGAFSRASLDPQIRIFGPGATVAQDLEPEYIATSHDSQTAWVTLQENNALAIVDIGSATVTQIVALGTKDHGLAGNGLDPSDRDGGTADLNGDGIPDGINIKPWPRVVGLYEPDGIASYKVGSMSYLVLANEGDVRADWPGYTEEIRVKDSKYKLDPARFPDAATLKTDPKLGRLKVSLASGDIDGDGDFDQICSYGGRSFSIRTATGALVWDSGDQFETKIKELIPAAFNVSNDNNAFDDRSDDKGPEPEGVTVGKAFGRTYAFIGLERVGGVMVYDVSNPQAPIFVDYANNRDFTKPVTDPLSGDLGPEGVIFISEENSPNGKPLVVLANEISGTTTIYEASATK